MDAAGSVANGDSGQGASGHRVGGPTAPGRFGLRRFPMLTLVVFGITAITNALQYVLPDLLPAWQRTPAGLHGQWWRSATTLLVQDGGVFGVLSTLAFLLVLGALAEQILGRPAWLVCYLGAGAVGELAGYAWQPYGAGKSVAVCGLAGALIVAALRADDRLRCRLCPPSSTGAARSWPSCRRPGWPSACWLAWLPSSRSVVACRSPGRPPRSAS